MENIAQAFTPPPGRLGHSMPAPERVGSPLERMTYRALHKSNAWASKEVEDGLVYHSQMLPQTKEAFGTPSFPAPLDKIRSRQEYRVTLDTVTEMSPEQSTVSDEQRTNLSIASGHELEHFIGGSMLSYSYHSQSKPSFGDSYLNNSFIRSFTNSLNTSLDIPSMHMSTTGNLFPSTARNPNKALVTISAKSSQILVANRTACKLFGYQMEQLLKLKVHSLFAEPYRAKQQALVEQDIDVEGGVVLIAGKVMDAVNSDGMEFPVSVWMKKVGSDGDHRVIVVIEPVARTSAKFELDHEGNIWSCDISFAHLFGYQATDDLIRKSATELMPSLVIPSLHDDECDDTKQRVTGRLTDGTAFPLMVQFASRRGLNKNHSGKVTVYTTLSGMISFLPNGKIHGCNHHFILMLTGYTVDQLKGQDITKLIPDFYLHIDFPDDDSIALPLSLEDSHSSSLFHAIPEDGVMYFNDKDQPLKGLGSKDDSGINNNEVQPKDMLERHDIVNGTAHSSDNNHNQSNNSFLDSSVYTEENNSFSHYEQKPFLSVLDDQASPYGLKDIPPVKRPHSARERSSRTPPMKSKLFASTPASLNLNSGGGAGEAAPETAASKLYIPEGTYMGDAMHKDGSLFTVVFQLKCIILSDNSELFCMWISRDCAADYSGMSTVDQSLSCDQRQQQAVVASPAWAAAASWNSSVEGMGPFEGEYEKAFETLKQIGKGAFGHVNLARRREDQLMVVVKFICKSSVLQDCWIEDQELGRVPLEISVLTKVNHVNIVKLLAAYENDAYFQMVMEKHGDGMDLFDFIDRNPSLDEPLVSYMFRQIINAVDYLHGKKILHRDIKDENIILDHCFTIKLIDFGSAAFMEEGKVFGTFCGTLEYCAPEVLLGNKYSGPALEMWSIGVTLYTLVYGENPFFDVEETISGHLQPPFPVSPGLLKVVLWLLHPDPTSRATIKDLLMDKWTMQPIDITDYLFEAVINGWPHIRKEKTINEVSGGEDMKESGVINHKNEANTTSNSLATSL